MGQLGILLKINKEFDKSEEIYSNIISIKELYYGTDSENLIQPLKMLAGVQTVKKEYQLSRETFERAVALGKKALDENFEKNRDKVGGLLMEVLSSLYALLESE